MMTQGRPYAGYATQAEARNRCCIYSEINKTPSCCALDVSANHAEKDGLVFLRTIAMPSQKHSSPTVECQNTTDGMWRSRGSIGPCWAVPRSHTLNH